MPRIQYDLPEPFVFSTELPIYTSHINWGGHLDNAQLLSLVGEARSRFFLWLDYEERRVEDCPIDIGDALAAAVDHQDLTGLRTHPCQAEAMALPVLVFDFHPRRLL